MNIALYYSYQNPITVANINWFSLFCTLIEININRDENIKKSVVNQKEYEKKYYEINDKWKSNNEIAKVNVYNMKIKLKKLEEEREEIEREKVFLYIIYLERNIKRSYKTKICNSNSICYETICINR